MDQEELSKEPETMPKRESIAEILAKIDGDEKRKGAARRFIEDERLRRSLCRDD